MTIKIILVLTTPVHGYAIIQEIDKLSDGSVKVAAGTMYGAIENLLKLNLIEEIPSRPHRRKEGKNPFKRFFTLFATLRPLFFVLVFCLIN